MLEHFVRYMHMFGHAGEQAPRRIFGLRVGMLRMLHPAVWL